MKVLVAAESADLRSALQLLLEDELALSVVGHAGGQDELLSLSRQRRPELILLDAALDGVPAATLIPRLRRQLPALRVVVLSDRWEAHPSATEPGDTLVSKADPPERLSAALRAIVAEAARSVAVPFEKGDDPCLPM